MHRVFHINLRGVLIHCVYPFKTDFYSLFICSVVTLPSDIREGLDVKRTYLTPPNFLCACPKSNLVVVVGSCLSVRLCFFFFFCISYVDQKVFVFLLGVIMFDLSKFIPPAVSMQFIRCDKQQCIQMNDFFLMYVVHNTVLIYQINALVSFETF